MISSTSAEFLAIRRPAVPTAAMAMQPASCASSTMPLMAAAVRSAASVVMAPPSFRPSPSRVSSARSVTAFHVPSAPASAMWNFTELVPTSSTA